ncbi:hypothetical protein [Bdellovibrio sp. HCB-162]|uniref:hypothetical protein n=1 Tax=Bdellovibrio sp. HCB-162 TaxID=3394234 RepID=UPI0039BCC9D4
MKRVIVFFFALVLTKNAVASLGHSHDDESLGYQTLCIGEGCVNASIENDTLPEDITPQAEYIQARIVPGTLPLKRITLRNPETDEIITVDQENPDIDFMTADGALAENLETAAYVLIPNYYFPSDYLRLAAKNGGGGISLSTLTVWNECKGSIIGRYVVGGKCSARPIHPSLMNVMQKDLLGIVGGSKVILVHKGIMGDARHQAKKSLHNTGRAIDVAEVIVDGKSYQYSKAVASEKSSERAFFLKLMAGWEAAVKRHCGNTVAATTINWTNKDHRKHLHLGTTYNCKN